MSFMRDKNGRRLDSIDVPARGEVPSALAVQAQSLGAKRPLPSRPQETCLATFAAGHGWGVGSGSVQTATTLNDTTDQGWSGSQGITVTTTGTGGGAFIDRAIPATFDPTGKTFVALVKIDSQANLNGLALYLGTSAGFSNADIFTMIPTSGGPFDNGVWNLVTFWKTSSVGTGGGTAPAYMRFRVTDRSTGPVTVKFGGLSFYTPKVFASTGIVSFTFDDTYGSQWSTVWPMFNATRTKATVLPILEYIGTAGKLTLAQLQQMAQSGWEIGGHSTTQAIHNAGLPSLSATDLETEMQATKNFLVQNGFKSESLAYPGGQANPAVRAACSRYYQYGRSTYLGGGESIPAGEYMKIRSAAVLNTDSLATVQGYVDNAYAKGQHLVLTFHDIQTTPSSTYQWSTANLQALLTYILGKGMPVMTLSDAITAMT